MAEYAVEERCPTHEQVQEHFPHTPKCSFYSTVCEAA
jgi:hypothetical protein